MPHTSFLRNHGKTSRTPRRPFEKERLDNEMKLIGEFGLKNKREVWRTQLTLARIRKAARTLLTLDEKDTKRMFEGGALLRRLLRLGVLDEQKSQLDYVLALKPADFLPPGDDTPADQMPFGSWVLMDSIESQQRAADAFTD